MTGGKNEKAEVRDVRRVLKAPVTPPGRHLQSALAVANAGRIGRASPHDGKEVRYSATQNAPDLTQNVLGDKKKYGLPSGLRTEEPGRQCVIPG
jgi:hypothetical protein